MSSLFFGVIGWLWNNEGKEGVETSTYLFSVGRAGCSTLDMLIMSTVSAGHVLSNMSRPSIIAIVAELGTKEGFETNEHRAGKELKSN